MKGYFVTDAQLSNLKERLELEKLLTCTDKKSRQGKIIEAVNKTLHQRVIRQLEEWIKQIS